MTAERILGWKPAAIVFDCDGTLMDTEQHWEKARELVLDEYGVAPDPDFGERTKGLHYTECGQVIAEAVQEPEEAEQIAARLLERFRKLVVDHPVTMPGAIEIVRRTSRFAPLAVASNCPRDVVESGLARAGLLPYLMHIVVPDESTRPKPHPDVYLSATRRCGVAPHHAMAVEDSHCGLLSAARARLRILGVGPRPPAETLELADLWLPSLDHPGLLDWADHRAP